MNKTELKKVLKPLIKECIKEVIFESEALLESRRRAAEERKQKLLSAVNADAYGGINVFEGTEPLSAGGSTSNETPTQGPLSDVDPNDPGIDITGILNLAGNRWSAHMK
jgi:hypothetical protein